MTCQLPTPLESVRSVLTELLRLYDWRFTLSEMERGNNEQQREAIKLLNVYGREKKAAWEAARRVLSLPSETTPMITAEQLAEVEDQCKSGLLVEHECPAMFALAAIYAELFTGSSVPSADTPIAQKQTFHTRMRSLPPEDQVADAQRRYNSLLNTLLTCKLRCGYILNYCPEGAEQMKGEAEEMLRIIKGAIEP